MNSVQPEDLVAWLKALQVTYRDHKDDLTELDSAIGDADHGINMDRGFTAVKAELDKGAGQDPGTVLKTVAMTYEPVRPAAGNRNLSRPMSSRCSRPG